MKSQQDFQTLNEYRDYLRDYYAGQILGHILFLGNRTLDQDLENTRTYAKLMVISLHGDWT